MFHSKIGIVPLYASGTGGAVAVKNNPWGALEFQDGKSRTVFLGNTWARGRLWAAHMPLRAGVHMSSGVGTGIPRRPEYC